MDFVLPDGSLFDCNVGLDETLPTQKFQGYGTFLIKTKERLKRYGLRPSRVESLSNISAECGDDEIGTSTGPVFPAAKLVVYSEFLGVKVSEEDTSINPRFGNFAEDLVIIPDGYEQTYHYARQTSCYKDMAFLDVPKLRLAIDIRPGRMNYSATNDGKAGMLGSRLAWLPRNSPVRCLWEVFNLFQDINLGLIRDDKFAYLPTALGGYGKPIPFGKASNFNAFCIRYKQGTHQGLARELVRRTLRRFDEYTIDKGGNDDPVLSAVSRLQSSWHDWVKGKSLYAPTCWLEAPPEVAKFRVATHGKEVRVDHALRRLQAEGLLVAECDLAIAYEHNLLCANLLSATEHKDFQKIRSDKRKEWLNLSTFSMRLYGLLQPLLVDQSLQGDYNIDSDYQKFWGLISTKKLHLRSFLRSENFYTREAKDFVYLNGPMKVKVPLVPRTYTMGSHRYWYEQCTDRQNDLETPEEFELLLNWVTKGDPTKTDPPSRKIVEDDPFILHSIKQSRKPNAGFCIVTDDIRLCREAHESTKEWIVRVPTKWYYMSMYYGLGDNPWEKQCFSKWPFLEWQTILDEGSISSYEEIGFRDGLPIKWPAERPFSLKTTSVRNNRRIRVQRTQPSEETDESWEPARFPDAFLFAKGHFLSRKRHPYRRGFA